MKELTPLERKIKAAALWTIRRLKEVPKCTTRYLIIPSVSDWYAGCDFIVYDNELKKFIRIEYNVWQGDEIVKREIPL